MNDKSFIILTNCITKIASEFMFSLCFPKIMKNVILSFRQMENFRYKKHNYEIFLEICSALDDRTQDPPSNPNPLMKSERTGQLRLLFPLFIMTYIDQLFLLSALHFCPKERRLG